MVMLYHIKYLNTLSFLLIIVHLYRVVQKTAQSLWHHNFATVHYRIIRFSAKCFERNSLRLKSLFEYSN